MNIEYTIKYSSRKSISIIIDRDRTVIVRAPFDVPETRIKTEVNKRKHLLLQKINHVQKYHLPVEQKEFVSGEMLWLLGNTYKLELVNEFFEGVKFDNKFIISRNNHLKAKSLLAKWYSQTAKEKLLVRVKEFSDKLGVKFNKVSIRDLKFRWGSCTPKNNIHFNWRLIKAPMYVIDYIIVHELVHLLVANHTNEFWNKVSIQLPAYKKAKDWLKEYGHNLEVEF